MTTMLTLADLPESLAGKTVLLRADLNVPVKDGIITDATRITRLVPTLQNLSARGAKIVLLSHFGRPKGVPVAGMSLKPVAAAVAAAVGRDVAFVGDCIGDVARTSIDSIGDGDIILLENLRFHAAEEKNDPDFAAQLAACGDIYINDAFSCAHRAHASTHALARLLPAYGGMLMAAELAALERALVKPEKPVTAIVGGAKISTKLDLLNNLVTRIDTLVLGGGMANTFLAATGHPVGASLCEHDMKDRARDILATAAKNDCRVILPVDAVVATVFRENPPTRIVPVTGVQDSDMMLDIGPDSVAHINDALSQSRTLLWNGPVGAFETKPFDAATMEIAAHIARLTRENGLISVAGGGDTVAAINMAGIENDVTYLSTAGGAFLEWLEGRVLPGVDILYQRAAEMKAA